MPIIGPGHSNTPVGRVHMRTRRPADQSMLGTASVSGARSKKIKQFIQQSIEARVVFGTDSTTVPQSKGVTAA